MLGVMGNLPHRYELNIPSFVVLGYIVLQNTTFVLIFSYKSLSAGFSLVDCIPYLLMCRLPIVVFIGFSRIFLMSFSVNNGQVFRKYFLISSSMLAFFWMNLLFQFLFSCLGQNVISTTSDFCVSKVTSHIPFCLFLVPFIFSCPFF